MWRMKVEKIIVHPSFVYSKFILRIPASVYHGGVGDMEYKLLEKCTLKIEGNIHPKHPVKTSCIFNYALTTLCVWGSLT